MHQNLQPALVSQGPHAPNEEGGGIPSAIMLFNPSWYMLINIFRILTNLFETLIPFF